MRQIWPGILLIFCIMGSSPLEAQAIQSPYRYVEAANSVGLFAGYLMIDEGVFGLAPSAAPFTGARYGRRLTGPLSADVGLALSPSNRTVFRRPTPSSDLEAFDETNLVLLLGEVGLRFHLTGQRTWRGIAPFVVGTAGFVVDVNSGDFREIDLPTDQLFRLGPGFAVAGGVGSDFFLSERFSVRVDVRDYLWRLSYPGGLSGTGERENEWSHNLGASLGGSIHF